MFSFFDFFSVHPIINKLFEKVEKKEIAGTEYRCHKLVRRTSNKQSYMGSLHPTNLCGHFLRKSRQHNWIQKLEGEISMDETSLSCVVCQNNEGKLICY